MPVYEYRCLECDERFQQRRPMEAADGAACPSGHDRVKRLLSVFAAARAGGSEPVGAPSGGGGCCGGACGCG